MRLGIRRTNWAKTMRLVLIYTKLCDPEAVSHGDFPTPSRDKTSRMRIGIIDLGVVNNNMPARDRIVDVACKMEHKPDTSTQFS
jgi:hypothetical protein